MEFLLILLMGAIGGVARGLAGFIKYYSSYKNVPFSWRYFGFTVAVSAFIGLGAAWTLESSGITFEGVPINPAVGFMFGYAGSDVLENLYKILVKKPILGPFNTVLKPSSKKKKK